MQTPTDLGAELVSLGLNTPQHIERIKHLRSLFFQTTIPDNELQKNVSRTLEQLSELPEFPLYCSLLILDEDTSSDQTEQAAKITIRYTAGICLKSSFSRGNLHPTLLAEHRGFLENAIFRCLNEAQPPLIRRVGKLNLVALVGRVGLLNSENILQFLVQCINSGNVALQAEALESLALIFQDMHMNSENIEDPDRIFSSPFIEELVKKLLQILEPQNSIEVRLPAFDCLTTLTVSTPAAIMERLPVIVSGLVEMLSTPDAATHAQVRERIYTFFAGLVQIHKEVFSKFVPLVFPKVLEAIHDHDMKVRRTALMIVWEWLTTDDQDDGDQHIGLIKDYLPTLIPGLIDNSLMTEEDKENRLGTTNIYLQQNSILEKGMSGTDAEDEPGILQGDEEDELEEEAEAMGSYTRRKLAMRSIHNIYRIIGHEGFHLMKARIDEMLQSNNDFQREAATAILGDCSDFVFDAIKTHIGPLLMFIRENTTSTNEFLVAGSIWAIGKFRKMILADESAETKSFMMGFLEILVRLLEHTSPIVKDAASDALRNFCKDDLNGQTLAEFYSKLVDHFAVLLHKNSQTRVFIMDTLAELAHTIQTDLEGIAALLNKTMPTLANLFDECPIANGEFVTLFDSISSIAGSSGPQFFPWAKQTLTRALTIARDLTLLIRKEDSQRSARKSKQRVQYESELNYQLMRCLDFIATLCDSLKQRIVDLDLGAPLAEIVLENLTSSNVMLKQVVYSLLGDLIPTLDQRLFEPHAKKIFQIVVDDCKTLPLSLDAGKIYTSVAANALYALGEVICFFPAAVNPTEVLSKIRKLYEHAKLHKVLSTNAALAFGRLALKYPQECSQDLEFFLKKVCYGFIVNASTAAERPTPEAIMGLNAAIVCKPAALLTQLAFYLEAIGQMQSLPAEASESTRKILHELLQAGPQILPLIQKASADISPQAKRCLQQKYGLGN